MYREYLDAVYEFTTKTLNEFEGDDQDANVFSRRKRLANLSNPEFVKKLIVQHENRIVDFKKTCFTDSFTGDVSVTTQHMIIKAIAGFLNSYGGHILIGIADDGEVSGVLADRFSDKDKYIRKIETLITNTLGQIASKYIDIVFPTFTKEEKIIVNDKNFIIKPDTFICIINVESSKSAVHCVHKEYNNQKKNDAKLPVDHSFFI